MKRKLAIFGVIVLTLFNLTALTTLAYRRWSASSMPWGIGDGEPGMRGLQRLGINEEQMSQLQESRMAFIERTEPLETDLHQLRSEMFELVHADTPDTLAIFALIDSIGAIQNALQKEAIVHMMDADLIFTPEQRTGFFEMFKRHMDDKWKLHRGRDQGIGKHGPPGDKWGCPAGGDHGPHEKMMNGKRRLRNRNDIQYDSVSDENQNDTTQGGN
jgi:Spy/CpxP family protein refolding chaperone